MIIELLKDNFSICKLKDIAAIDTNSIFFLAKTDEEISLVCQTNKAPYNSIKRDDGWKGFRIQGELDFSLIGILSNISSTLAENQISVFAISTYNTDYFFVKIKDLDKAVDCLKNAGNTVIEQAVQEEL